MSGSRNDWLMTVMSSEKTVFTIDMLRVMLGAQIPNNIGVLLNRLVRRGVIGNPRRGIYTKNHYNREELSCIIYTPCYISLEYVLRKAGIIFQYSDAITCVSYKTSTIEVDGKEYDYSRIKGELMVAPEGIVNNGIYSTASPERALLDTLYLNSNYTFDFIGALDYDKVISILPIYRSKSLEMRVAKLFSKV